jgi:DNA (cytosine-5)-methyltransferase 1
MTFGSLFAGIGGFDLGFERAGLKCEWQVEIDPYCRRVLAKHWPDVRRHDDVRTFPPEGEWGVDVICGGFPCQDISEAGKWLGLDGERSGLWREFARIIRVVRPRLVVVENVSALLFRGLGDVLADLAGLGFDAEWGVLPLCALGAPHTRERVFIVANADRRDLRASGPDQMEVAPTGFSDLRPRGPGQLENWWTTQPEPCSVVYGLPGIVDRLRPYGNTVSPVAAEWIGRRLMSVA